jgi:hypothetical protein
MRGGAPRSKDIWTDVKLSIDSFAREASAGDTVTIYAFDSDVRQIEVATPADVSRELLKLDAKGQRTYLGLAIRAGLDRAASLRTRADLTRNQAVVLFTDGKDNPPDIEDPVRIGANLDRVGDTFVFFVSTGEHELQLDDFAKANANTTVLKAPTRDAIRNVSREIRAKIAPRPQPPKAKVVQRPAPPPPPPPKKSFPVLTAAIAFALLALAAFVLLKQQQKKNRLEGELEILRPHAAPDAAFVGLPNLQASEVALSAILPVDALAGSDARLFVRRKAGRKRVWIAAQNGSLHINDVETPMSELYDADTIEIGAAKLRFNRAGDERPLESNQEADL